MNDRPDRIQDIAHLGSVELLTPDPTKSLWYFRDMLGMEIVHHAGRFLDYATPNIEAGRASGEKKVPLFDPA